MMLDVSVLAGWIERLTGSIEREQEHLTELDAAIGDGDHGANMARGFKAVREKIAQGKSETPADLFKLVAMTLISTVGGASGPLYGTFFLEASKAAGDARALDLASLHTVLAAGLAGVRMRGKAVPGDKTMVDALTPAVDALVGDGDLRKALEAAAVAAADGAEQTRPLVAHKGRASYLGERAIGHKDPGAASSVLLFASLAQEVAELEA
ncbi:MAG: dihydroxyacetone kinase subunit DhaL [Acidihalobacter sp.]|uniref:dihydroxyacetone kinase subunit DhaL n=1 Tax=Acidihalobacter sp. TaxID=1872108 RepID=UPI00307F2A29